MKRPWTKLTVKSCTETRAGDFLIVASNGDSATSPIQLRVGQQINLSNGRARAAG